MTKKSGSGKRAGRQNLWGLSRHQHHKERGFCGGSGGIQERSSKLDKFIVVTAIVSIQIPSLRWSRNADPHWPSDDLVAAECFQASQEITAASGCYVAISSSVMSYISHCNQCHECSAGF